MTSSQPPAIIFGAPRSGTTSLWRHLVEHPDIRASRVKEANYFRDPANMLAGYGQCFPDGSGVTLEASPIYFRDHLAAVENLARAVPEARLICILREPASRLAAYFRGETHMPGRVAADVDFARYARIVADGSDPAPINPRDPAMAAYVRDGSLVGNYADVLAHYLDHFTPEQILVLFLDDLKSRPEEVVAACCRHIGVDPARMPELTFGAENQGAYVKNARLFQALRTINAKLEPLLNRAPGLRRRLKALHHRFNAEFSDRHKASDDAGRAILRDWYVPANDRLRAMVELNWPHTNMPGWVTREAERAG